MKKISIFFLALILGIGSCKEDEQVVDPIYEFVAFPMETALIGEADYTTVGYPVVVQLWAFKPYSEDITVTLEVTPHNVTAGTDFTVDPSTSVVIPSGSLTSDTIWVHTVNNDDPNELERTIDIKIASVSKSDTKIGLGITDPKQGTIVLKINDDECSGDPICNYNVGTLVLRAETATVVDNVSVIVDKSAYSLTLNGNIADYSVFPDATLTITLVPDGAGSSTGTVTFPDQDTGVDDDGYFYQFRQVGTGSYDATAGTATYQFDVYYQDGGWVYWYTKENNLSLP